MRDRFPVLVLGGLLLASLLGVLLIRSAQRGSYADVSSTYRSREGGTRALYLLASEQGLPVTRRTSELLHLEPGMGLVFFGVRFNAPPEHWKIVSTPGTARPFEPQNASAEPPPDAHPPGPSGEDGAVDSEDGTPATPVTFAPGSQPAAADDDDAEDVHGAVESGVPPSSVASVSGQELRALLNHLYRGQRALHAPALAEDALLDALGVRMVAGPGSAPRRLVPATPHPLTHGIGELLAPVSGHLDALPDDAIPLIEDAVSGKPVAAWVPAGEGAVVVVTAPALFDNQHLVRLDNATWALQLLAWVAGSEGRIAFDEYHHGFQSERSLVRFGARYGLHWTLLQLLLGLTVWALSLRRFGPPRPPEVETRNNRIELLEASARLYREGGHARWCASRIARWLTRSLAPTAGVRIHAEPTEVIAGLRARGLERLAQGLEEVQSAAHASTRPAELLQTARAASRTFRLPRDAGRPLSNDSHRERDAA
ncbi:MAG TPA: DUF4350 domain-containing protein [Myxococcaceae bacterium]|nr:DUF4350 domain-containing protein [Myxococcaceae bacterium]